MLAASLCLLASLPAVQTEIIEIQFEPMGPGGAPGNPGELMEMLAGGGHGRHDSHAGPKAESTKSKENELDEVLSHMLGGPPPPRGMSRREEHNRALKELFGEGPPAHEVVGKESDLDRAIGGVLSDILGGGGKHPMHPMMLRGSPGPGEEVVVARGGGVPVQMFRDLFPGPMAIEELGPGGESISFGGPDPLVMDMMQHFGHAFQEDALPVIHKASGASRAPDSCHSDLNKHCGKARSQLHCLGQHVDDISDACRKDVGKSVPFLCSSSIDKWCDVLQNGILSCLTDNLQNLDGACRDAVLATRDLITKANTHKTSIVDSDTGKKTVHVPSPVAALKQVLQAVGGTPAQREAQLDASVAGPLRANRSQRVLWLAVSFASVALLAYLTTFTDSFRRAQKSFKPFLAKGEDSKPLMKMEIQGCL